MLQEIRRLRRIAWCCQNGVPLEPKLASWLGESLDCFLSRNASTVDAALGLRSAKGGIPWWREDAIRIRDDALRAYAKERAPDESLCAQARLVCQASRRYAASAWRIDRNAETVPVAYANKAKAYLWLAFKSGATMPVGERQLRNILRD